MLPSPGQLVKIYGLDLHQCFFHVWYNHDHILAHCNFFLLSQWTSQYLFFFGHIAPNFASRHEAKLKPLAPWLLNVEVPPHNLVPRAVSEPLFHSLSQKTVLTVLGRRLTSPQIRALGLLVCIIYFFVPECLMAVIMLNVHIMLSVA